MTCYTKGGIGNVLYSISNTAEYGTYYAGERVVGGKEQLKKRLRKVLEDIRSGKFASDWVKEYSAGAPNFKAQRRRLSESQIEEVGEKLRAMMPWLAEHRLVDQKKN